MTHETLNPRPHDGARRVDPRIAFGIALSAGLLAAFVRWYFVTHAQVLQPLYEPSGWGDAAEYYRYAWHLVHQGIFSSDALDAANPASDSFRDPAYPLFLALMMKITNGYDSWYAAVLLAQAFTGGIAVTCATLALRDALPRWLLAVAGVSMALWPHLVAIPAYVLTENLTTLFCALTALALAEAARRPSIAWTIAAGLALALAALTNAVLGPVFLLLSLMFAWKRTLSRRQLLVFAAIVATPLLAWGIRNSNIPGPFSASFRAEINLIQGSWPTYHLASQLSARHDPVGIETIKAIDLEIAILHHDRVAGLQTMFERMGHAPLGYLEWYLGKPMLLWGWEIALGSGDIYVYPTRNSPFIVNPVFKAIEAITFIFNGLLALSALAGVVIVAVRRTPSAAMLTFAVMATWVTVVYGVLQSDARYSIPFRPGEIALACLTASAAFDAIGRRLAAKHQP